MHPKSSRSERSRALELALAAAAILAGLVTTPPGAVVQAQQAGSVPYPLVYVRAPRLGDTTLTHWPEVMNAIRQEPGSDLILRQPSGSEEVLFAAGNGGVMDPVVSFDARKVLFAYSPDLRASALNSQRANAPRAGWDIYAIDLASRQVTRLTQQEWTPPSGAVNWSSELLSAAPANSYYLGYGVFNLGPMPLPGRRIAFSSSRDGYLPNKNWAFPNLRLYVMDEDGSNVEKIGHLNIGSALHPTVLADGRIMFASWEEEANRDPRVWGLWAIHPDGSNWEPLFSAFNLASALHFQTQFSDRCIGGLDWASHSVRSSVALAGRAANAELADLFAPAQDNVRTLLLAASLDNAREAALTVSIADPQRNDSRIVREFSLDTDTLLRDGFE
jgi:hypothetical protein